MKKLLLNLYFWPAFVLATLVGMSLLPVALPFELLVRRRSLRSTIRRAIRLYGWSLVRLVPFFGPVRVRYKAGDLPLPAIFVANHNSAIDPYLFGAIPVENGFVTSWPFRIPIYNIFMHLAGYANADKGWEEIQSKGGGMLRDGSCLTIWPEGHRSRDGQLGRFKRGAFRLSVETGYPLIPVCIVGSRQIMPPGTRLLNPGRVTMLVLPPEYPGKGEDTQEVVAELRGRVRKVMEKTLAEHGHFDRVKPSPSNGPEEGDAK